MSGDAFIEPHDKISFSIVRGPVISERCAELYASGLSLEGVARELGIAKASVRGHLKAAGISLRPCIHTPAGRLARKEHRLAGNSPYGYVFIQGQLVEHPKEIEVVRKMRALWKSGSSFCAIAKKINSQGYRTRKGTPWRHPTIAAILRRESQETQTSESREV